MKVRKTSRWQSVNQMSNSWAEYHKKLMKELGEELSNKLIEYAKKYGDSK